MTLFIIIMSLLWLAASLHEARQHKAEQDYWHNGNKILEEKRKGIQYAQNRLDRKLRGDDTLINFDR